MTASNAVDANGAKVSVSTVAFDGAAHTTWNACDALTYTQIGDLQNVPDAGSITTNFEETTILDGNGWKSMKPTLHEMTNMSLEVNYVRTDATQKALVADQIAKTKRVWQVMWPDGTKDYIPAYVSQTKRGIQVGKIVKGSFTLQPDGQPFFAT